MGDRAPQLNPEQFPLLKVDGGGDMSHPQPAQTVVTGQGWEVSCTNKSSRFSRLPEFISACWMTIILFGISFLVFYALGMGVYRRHQFIIVKCNTSKQAANVYYHHIVPRGSQIPFIIYSEYLANMATQYPKLHFDVQFLVDDSYPFSIHTKRNIPHFLYNGMSKFRPYDEMNKDALTEFQKRYQNVNITIIPLSNYMTITPLRFKWRTIPMSHLLFYVRVFSVWQNGGIGIDLRTFNNEYHNHHNSDRRIDAILRQHNDGINNEEYASALKKIDKDELNAVFKLLCGMIKNIFNDTREFFNRTLSYQMPIEQNNNDPLIRTHMSKRETNLSEFAVTNATDKGAKDSSLTVYQTTTNVIKILENATTSQKNAVLNETTSNIKWETTPNLKAVGNVISNNSEAQPVVLFYDFVIISEDIGPSYHIPDPFNFNQPGNAPMKRSAAIRKPSKPPAGTPSYLLSLDAEGTFIAASSKLHPFLGHLISVGCQRMPSRFAIQDALLTQCSDSSEDDVYCNNIYIL